MMNTPAWMNCKLKEVVLHVPVEVIRDLMNLNHDILHVIQPFFIIYSIYKQNW